MMKLCALADLAASMIAVKDGYSPGEFYSPEAPHDQSSDLYSLGIILYEMLTRHEPFPVPKGNFREVLPRIHIGFICHGSPLSTATVAGRWPHYSTQMRNRARVKSTTAH